MRAVRLTFFFSKQKRLFLSLDLGGPNSFKSHFNSLTMALKPKSIERQRVNVSSLIIERQMISYNNLVVIVYISILNMFKEHDPIILISYNLASTKNTFARLNCSKTIVQNVCTETLLISLPVALVVTFTLVTG